MVQKDRMAEANTALGKAYAALHFVKELWEYDSKDMRCYLVISELRAQATMDQLNSLAKKIHSLQFPKERT